MAEFKSVKIDDVVTGISKRKYLIPAFQREYVWDMERVERLFDSIMRGYPISSMLFWEVRDKNKSTWKFYEFLKKYRKPHYMHNEFFETKSLNESFFAVLDGQQRLTSLYLALFGSYDIGKSYTKWRQENKENYFNVCHMYFNLTHIQATKNTDVEYEFLWLDREITKEKIIYEKDNQKWFKIGELYNDKYKGDLATRRISKEWSLSESEEERLGLLHTRIFKDSIVNFYLEDAQDSEKAVNIFIRINAGGKPLDYSDILFSILIANWKNNKKGLDARTQINKLVDDINQNFSISKDLILKGFLYLFHNNIKFSVNSFNDNFVELIEDKWDSIRDCFIVTFELLTTFGLESKTLSSNNVILPILYFIYHKNLITKIIDSPTQKENRDIIQKWILRALILKPFGGSADTVLANTRKAFISEFERSNKKYFDENMDRFPLSKIEEKAKYTRDINDDFFEELMNYRKNTPEAFAILSFLRLDLKYKIIRFDKDHLHPESLCKSKGLDIKKYDSLPNLQMLDYAENRMSKQAKPLEQWVQENCGNDRKGFLKKHLIPDIDLSLENFDEFYEARKKLLIEKLKEILN